MGNEGSGDLEIRGRICGVRVIQLLTHAFGRKWLVNAVAKLVCIE